MTNADTPTRRPPTPTRHADTPTRHADFTRDRKILRVCAQLHAVANGQGALRWIYGEVQASVDELHAWLRWRISDGWTPTPTTMYADSVQRLAYAVLDELGDLEEAEFEYAEGEPACADW